MKEEVIYKEKGRFSTSPKLEYDQYLLSLKRFVKYCNEIIFVNENGNFLLPRRRSEKSAAGTWFFGGQVLAFLKLQTSVKKTLRREAGINLPTSRFKHIGQIRHWYSGRETDNPAAVPSDVSKEKIKNQATSNASNGRTFENCTEAFDAGVFNIRRSDASYQNKLDRDNDGIACEK
jgi:hypothetical protein